MARTWPSIRVDLIEGHGEQYWPRPGRILTAACSRTFKQLANAVDDTFARWDRSHLQEFTLADGRRLCDPDPGLGDRGREVTADYRRVKLSRLPAPCCRGRPRRIPRSAPFGGDTARPNQRPDNGGNVRIGPGGSRSLFFRAIRWSRRFGGGARSIAEGLADAASAPAQCRPGIGHPPVGCLYPQITAEEKRAALHGTDGGRDIGLLTGDTRCLVVQSPGRAAADDLGYQRRARGARGDPRPLPAIEHLREPAQALAGMPASLRVEVHSDLAALVRLPRPWPG